MNKKSAVTFYLNNLVKTPLPPKDTESVLEFIDNSSSELFGVEFSEKWGRAPRRRGAVPSSEPATGIRSLRALREVLKSKKIPNIIARGTDTSIDCLVDLFGINDTQRSVLQFFICLARYPMLRALVGEFLDSGRFSCRVHVSDVTLLAMLCGISSSAVSNTLSDDNVLIHSGLLVIDSSDGEVYLNRRVRHALDSNVKSIAKLKNTLLGKPHRGNMNLDFSHVRSEYDYIKCLIDQSVKQEVTGINILIYGPTGTGKTEMVKQIVTSLGYDLYSLHSSNKTRQDKDVSLSYLMYAQRILAKDAQSVIMLDEAEDVFRFNAFSNAATSKLSLNQILERNPRPVIWITNDVDCMDDAYLRRFTYCFNLKRPDKKMRCQIWRAACVNNKFKLSKSDIDTYAHKYDVAPGVINSAIRAAKITGMPDAISRTIDSVCIAMTGRVPTPEKTSAIAFDTKLLNTDTDMTRLTHQIVNSGRKNFSLCLYGASGTGKSAYARYLAQQMGIKTILKRASDLKGMYVGQTEQNIAAAFYQAHQQGAMLIFDEADSFLRDRTMAHAGWEVSAVNEMLTQMESATIPFICTTNLMNDLDAASLRRFLFKIKYDYMTLPQVRTAFQDFFNQTPTDNQIAWLKYLTPGDFSVVHSKAEFMNITDVSELVKMLTAEMDVKKDVQKKSHKIGFMA